MLNSAVFYLLSTLAAASALLAVTRRNVFHGALFLCSAFLATAGIFLQLQAEFLFAIELFLFAGGLGIASLMAFRMAQSAARPAAEAVPAGADRNLPAAVAAILLGALLCFAAFAQRKLPQPLAAPLPARNAAALSAALFGHFLLPLEMISILLVVCTMGVAIAARRGAQ